MPVSLNMDFKEVNALITVMVSDKAASFLQCFSISIYMKSLFRLIDKTRTQYYYQTVHPWISYYMQMAWYYFKFGWQMGYKMHCPHSPNFAAIGEWTSTPKKQKPLLYSWRVSRYSAPIHWHLTMKLFPAKCHERATLRKLWRQTGNSSLLPAKCWPLLHVIAGISAWFSNFVFALFCYITNHLMTGPLGYSEFCFPRISMKHHDWDSRETKFTVPLGTSH